METHRRLRLKIRKTVVPQPILCNSPSPSSRAAGRQPDSRRMSFERCSVSKSTGFTMHIRTPSQPIIPKIDLSGKEPGPRVKRYQGKLPEVTSHTSSPISVSKEFTANYARRMKRIRMQVTELAAMGLISSRGNEPLLSDFQQRPLTRSRMNSAEFWGHKEKLELIKKLGYTEAYREFEARKSVQKTRVLSPQHLRAEEVLRQSCPVSPTLLIGPTVRQSVVSTASSTPEERATKPHVSALNKIMWECDQYFIEKAGKRAEITPKALKSHMRTQSEAELGTATTTHAAQRYE